MMNILLCPSLWLERSCWRDDRTPVGSAVEDLGMMIAVPVDPGVCTIEQRTTVAPDSRRGSSGLKCAEDAVPHRRADAEVTGLSSVMTVVQSVESVPV